jgi:hypothetical protein
MDSPNRILLFCAASSYNPPTKATLELTHWITNQLGMGSAHFAHQEAIWRVEMIRRDLLKAAGVASIVLCFGWFCASAARAQQKLPWQGAVKPDRINVYSQPSTRESVVVRTLGHGDVVNVILEVTVLDSAWCRVALPNEPDPIGYVLCFNLEPR